MTTYTPITTIIGIGLTIIFIIFVLIKYFYWGKEDGEDED